VNEDDRIDTLIDEVAQAMTSAPPAGDDFARKVSRRIAEAGERRTSWLRPWVLVPLAAAIVLIVLVRLKPDTTDALRTDALRTDAVRSQPGATPPAVARVDSPAPPVNVVTAPRTTPAPAAIAGIQPVAMAPIEIDPIAIEPLVETNAVQITPIAIDRIDISPMP